MDDLTSDYLRLLRGSQLIPDRGVVVGLYQMLPLGHPHSAIHLMDDLLINNNLPTETRYRDTYCDHQMDNTGLVISANHCNGWVDYMEEKRKNTAPSVMVDDPWIAGQVRVAHERNVPGPDDALILVYCQWGMF